MASSKVMASRSPPNPDLPRQPSSAPLNLNLQSDHSRGGFRPNTTMDNNYFTGMYSDSASFALDNNGDRVGAGSSAADGGGGSGEMRNGGANNMVDDVWRHLANGGGGGGSVQPPMTLEDFMVKVGPGGAEAARAPAPMTVGGVGIETVMMNHAAAVVAPVQFSPAVRNGLGVEFGNGIAAVGGGGRGKRRAAVEDVPLDKATQQKQRRMIKNRESAARSRERKQAYTVELESLVTQLQEDNARLMKEEAELKKERYKQLMENLIPVTEKRRPPRVLRRVHSMEW